jgi:hypothetical protein
MWWWAGWGGLGACVCSAMGGFWWRNVVSMGYFVLLDIFSIAA